MNHQSVGDGKAMTTTTGGLSDIRKTLDGENKKLQQEQQAILAEKEMKQQKQVRLDRDNRVSRASRATKVKI